MFFKCACGKSHGKFAKTQIVTINGNKWDLDCYLKKMHEEYKTAQIEAMMSQLVLSKVKSSHPEIDIEGLAKKVAEELNESFANEPKDASI